MDNPYASPETSAKSVLIRRGYAPWLAILLGIVIFFVGLTLFCIAFALAYSAYHSPVDGFDPEIGFSRLESAQSGPIFWFLNCAALGVLAFAGYMTARMVRLNELRNGVILATLLSLIGFALEILLEEGEAFGRLTFVMALVEFAAVVAGAALGGRHNRATVAEAIAEASRPGVTNPSE